MKLKTIYISAMLILLAMSASADTKEAYGKIIKIKGEAFISQNGKTKAIKLGDFIYPNSELVIEHVGQLSFSTSEDEIYHLGKSSSMMVSPKNMVLRSGEVWFQSLNKSNKSKISTANADVVLSGGEGILVYDSLKAKTQLVVVNGLMQINNVRAPEVAISISEGNFSYVDNTYDNGIPRDPTPVGEKTYNELVAHFPGVFALDKNTIKVFSKESENSHAKLAHLPVEKSEATDEVLSAYRDILISTPSTSNISKKSSSRKIASVVNNKKLVGADKSVTPFKVFGMKGDRTMTFGEEFKNVPKIDLKGSRGPASFAAPEVIEQKAGDTKVLEDHDRETKKLIQELGNL